MTHNRSIDAARDPWRDSLRRSRERRAAAGRARRWSLRRRSVTVCACAVMALGGGVALAGNGGSDPAAGQYTSADSAPTSLAPGSSGAAVKRLQRRLGVQATGFYGPLTRKAVARFQRRSGLQVDGVAGPATLNALGIRVVAQEASSGTGSGDVPATLQRIAQCESGGDPTAVSAGGTYRGKYQFDVPTWEAMGGTGDPAAAPESVQDRLAVKLYRQRGTAPWGRCANA
jgi:hypothetical protein